MIMVYDYKISYKIILLFFVIAKKLPPDVNKRAVFACNELDLKEVNVYGFDYDYTLAHYKPSMDFLLYNLGRDTLIQKHKVIIACFLNKVHSISSTIRQLNVYCINSPLLITVAVFVAAGEYYIMRKLGSVT